MLAVALTFLMLHTINYKRAFKVVIQNIVGFFTLDAVKTAF